MSLSPSKQLQVMRQNHQQFSFLCPFNLMTFDQLSCHFSSSPTVVVGVVAVVIVIDVAVVVGVVFVVEVATFVVVLVDIAVVVEICSSCCCICCCCF